MLGAMHTTAPALILGDWGTVAAVALALAVLAVGLWVLDRLGG
jgi:hypothetical protein